MLPNKRQPIQLHPKRRPMRSLTIFFFLCSSWFLFLFALFIVVNREPNTHTHTDRQTTIYSSRFQRRLSSICFLFAFLFLCCSVEVTHFFLLTLRIRVRLPHTFQFHRFLRVTVYQFVVRCSCCWYERLIMSFSLSLYQLTSVIGMKKRQRSTEDLEEGIFCYFYRHKETLLLYDCIDQKWSPLTNLGTPTCLYVLLFFWRDK